MKNNISLRDVNEEDLPIFFEHQRDKDANRMAAFPARDKKAFMDHWTLKILDNKVVIKKTILFNGNVAGNIVSWEQDSRQEVGYWIGKQFWGKGIASRALSEFLALLTIRPLFAQVAKHNIGSLKVLERNGFTIFNNIDEFSKDSGEVIEGYILKLE